MHHANGLRILKSRMFEQSLAETALRNDEEYLGKVANQRAHRFELHFYYIELNDYHILISTPKNLLHS